MAYIRAGQFTVESIGPGNKKGIIKVFNSSRAARTYAKAQYKKGRGVVLERVLKYGEKQVAQKGLKRTAFKGIFAQDFGNL